MAIGFVVGRPQILVVKPNDRLSEAKTLAGVLLYLFLIGVGTIIVEGQLWRGCRLKNAFQRLHREEASPSLDDGYEKEDHQQDEQNQIIFDLELTHESEPEVDEWTKVGGI
jgi:hypothetical protein